MSIQVKDKADFDEKLKNAGGRLVLVTFHATWCGPCKQLGPKIEEMVEEFPEVTFFKVDVDACENLASLYNISCMPTFVFLKNGAKVAEFSGANEKQLREWVIRHKSPVTD
jgi:thioredoxin 1